MIIKAKLFEEGLEQEDRLSRGHIIHYLSDQARKMEKTRDSIKSLLYHLTSEGFMEQGTQTPAAILGQGGTRPEGTGPALGEPVDLTQSSDSTDGPPEMTTPPPSLLQKMDWKNVELPSTEELVRPTPFLKETVPKFRIPMSTPRKILQKSTGGRSGDKRRESTEEELIWSIGKLPLPRTPINSS